MLFKHPTAISIALSSAAVHLAKAQDPIPTTTATEDPWLASGCSMAQGTALMTCLGDYASIPPAAPSGLPEVDQAAYYCDIYQQLANCWAAGIYCKEWYPMQLAADKFCALANSTTSSSSSAGLPGIGPQITTLPPAENTGLAAAGAGIQDVQPTPAPVPAGDSSAINTLSSIIAEASNVITSIWNNDSGTDIPVISNDLATETGSQVTWTHMTESTPLPATDPLGTITVDERAGTATVTPAPARIRRKIVLN